MGSEFDIDLRLDNRKRILAKLTQAQFDTGRLDADDIDNLDNMRAREEDTKKFEQIRKNKKRDPFGNYVDDDDRTIDLNRDPVLPPRLVDPVLDSVVGIPSSPPVPTPVSDSKKDKDSVHRSTSPSLPRASSTKASSIDPSDPDSHTESESSASSNDSLPEPDSSVTNPSPNGQAPVAIASASADKSIKNAPTNLATPPKSPLDSPKAKRPKNRLNLPPLKMTLRSRKKK